MSHLLKQIDKLSPEEKRAFLAQLLLRRKASKFSSFPLSFAQQRLWFLAQLQPGGDAYNNFSALHLKGSLNIVALEKSLNEIIRRHEILRTTFVAVEGQPVQIIAPSFDLALPLVDLRQLLEAEREVEVKRLATEEAQQPFDLATGPLVRITLLHLTSSEHVVLLTMHHIVSDGWSIGILIRELVALYESFSSGKPSPLPELPIQYADFAVWQRQWLQGEVLESQLAYWRQHLEGAVSVLQLPTDRPRASVQTFQGATQSFSLSRHLTERLKTLSRQEGVTLFMTLLAAFKTLLHRYSGQDDIVVGLPIANRNWTEIEGLIGFFVNTLVLRTELSGNPSFRQLLFRVREVALGAYSHQDLPFEYLVETLQPERSLSHNPLFQVTFNLQNDLMEELRLPELTLRSVEKESRTAKFDLSLSMVDTESGLAGALEYNTDLFDASTISRMLGHFQTLLEGIVGNPEQQLSDLPLLTAQERHQLLVQWNDTQADYPNDACIHQLFEAQVEQTPDAVALVFQEEQLTYQQLNERVNQLAHYLQSLGVGPEVLVGICVERSIELLVGLLGILKAGGAYVPLEAGYPLERLAFILEDTQTSVLLTQERLVEELPVSWAQVICLDSDWEVIAQQSWENPVSEVRSENLAYLMYTSGSTGRPKGVSAPHQGIVRLVKENNYASLSAKEVFLQLAPVSFDASTFEIWGCLLNGAQLVLFPNHIPSLKELGQTLQQYQITTLWLTAGLFHLMVDEQLEDLRYIQQLLAGGDVLSAVHVSRVLQKLTEGKLINGYGPTESTTFTCCHCVTSDSQVGASINIGRPIANTQIYLLDGHLHPVPVGVVGELYISGDGLARGYFNQPALTAEKFVPNPFSQSGKRLYKTGDLARYLPDGNLEFLGRIDHQVKIRGFRIELSEIEAVLSQHQAVLQNVVIVREDVPGDKRLVAYVVLKQEPATTLSDLRCYLKEQLPEYMVPSVCVLLDALPLTPNGKVNRQALPVPDQGKPELEMAHQAPQTDLERTIHKVWQEALHVEEIGIHDNFFDLGGNSLLLVEVHSKLLKILKLDFPIVVTFQYPTISSLTKHLGHAQSEQPDSQQSYDRRGNRIASTKRRKQVIQERRAAKKQQEGV